MFRRVEFILVLIKSMPASLDEPGVTWPLYYLCQTVMSDNIRKQGIHEHIIYLQILSNLFNISINKTFNDSTSTMKNLTLFYRRYHVHAVFLNIYYMVRILIYKNSIKNYLHNNKKFNMLINFIIFHNILVSAKPEHTSINMNFEVDAAYKTDLRNLFKLAIVFLEIGKFTKITKILIVAVISNLEIIIKTVTY